MKVLVVDEEIPLPLNSGKRLRTYNLLRNLSDNNEIYFLCRRHETIFSDDSEKMSEAGIKSIVVPHNIRKKNGLKFYFALLANLFSKFPYTVESHYSKQLADAAISIVKEKKIDIIHCEWTPYAVNLEQIIKKLPSVVVAHNVESMIWRRNFEVENNLFKKIYIYFQWKKMERFEAVSFKKFTRSISVSEQDKKIISGWVEKEKIDLVSNGVDVDYFSKEGNDTESCSLVFTGTMDWRPNVDGIINFLDKIWPLVKQKYPDCTLTIVGRSPMDILKARVASEKSVVLTGTVDDVRPFMKESMVYIVPLRVGGGSRLKILEALSMKMPVVSTSVGAEGLDVKNNKEIIIANTPVEFTTSIDKLFRDKKLRDDLGNAGRALVEEKYQWSKLSEKLETSWRTALESQRQ